jgi:hypothetical protein
MKYGKLIFWSWIWTLGILPAGTGNVMGEVNVPSAESSKVLYDPRTKSEMDDLASADETAKFTAALNTDWTLFVEDRTHSIRKSSGLPRRWLNDLSAHTQTFNASAQPGEFYVFQIGVFAAKSAVQNLAVEFTKLSGPNEEIPAANLRCFNLGGTNFMGRPFHETVGVAQGKLQALWIGIDVPKTAQGAYRSKIVVKDGATGVSQSVNLEIAVAGAVLEDHGDRDSWRLSRLRWLDSTIGLNDDVVTTPFVPIVRQASTLQVLGRELVLGADGLPQHIRSFFNADNTAILKQSAHELLGTPFHFVVETTAGPVKFVPSKITFTCELKGAVNWHATSRARGLDLTINGLLEYDGFSDFHCQLTSTAPLRVKDVRLEMNVAAGAGTYFMGLGRKGGHCPESVDWKWNTDVNQDGFWLGAVNGGLKLQLYGANWRTPLINCYYHFRPLNIPESWGGADGQSGGVHLVKSSAGAVQALAYSGPCEFRPGQALDFNFKLFLTPFKPLDTDAQWSQRYLHPVQGVTNQIFYHCDQVKAMGANLLNIHQNEEPNPTINYPYFDLSMPLLKKSVENGHANGVKVKIYYTTREITCNLPELFAFWSLNGEIICASPSQDGKNAHPLTNPDGPHPWLLEHLGETGFIPAWREVIGGRYSNMLDLAVITAPDSRLDNFYCEGLAFTLRETDFDGMYIDDTALGRKSLQRAHRIFEAEGKRLLADMHSWNHWDPTAGQTPSAYCYMQNFPYYHRLWFGEAFDYNNAPDYWLVEISGIPFGLMGEMLQDGGNKWRGMLFGMTQRLGWSGDPRPEWKFWDEFGMQGTAMLGWWNPSCPVKTERADVLATVYKKNGKSLVALASWAAVKTTVKLAVNWQELGLDPKKTTLWAPAIEGFQTEAVFAADGAIPVEPGRGWLLVADETPRKLKGGPLAGDPTRGL